MDKMKTNTDFLLNFIFTIALTVLIFAVLKLSKDNKTMRAEINELRLLFNQKFLQEMAVNKPVVRFEF
jgi:hypothetical protein